MPALRPAPRPPPVWPQELRECKKDPEMKTEVLFADVVEVRARDTSCGTAPPPAALP